MLIPTKTDNTTIDDILKYDVQDIKDTLESNEPIKAYAKVVKLETKLELMLSSND